MNLVIISPQHKEIYTIEYISAQTDSGAIIIKKGHAPIMLTLTPGHEFSFMLQSGEVKSFFITRPGFLEVDRTTITALINKTNE